MLRSGSASAEVVEARLPLARGHSAFFSQHPLAWLLAIAHNMAWAASRRNRPSLDKSLADRVGSPVRSLRTRSSRSRDGFFGARTVNPGGRSPRGLHRRRGRAGQKSTARTSFSPVLDGRPVQKSSRFCAFLVTTPAVAEAGRARSPMPEPTCTRPTCTGTGQACGTEWERKAELRQPSVAGQDPLSTQRRASFGGTLSASPPRPRRGNDRSRIVVAAFCLEPFSALSIIQKNRIPKQWCRSCRSSGIWRGTGRACFAMQRLHFS